MKRDESFQEFIIRIHPNLMELLRDVLEISLAVDELLSVTPQVCEKEFSLAQSTVA